MTRGPSSAVPRDGTMMASRPAAVAERMIMPTLAGLWTESMSRTDVR